MATITPVPQTPTPFVDAQGVQRILWETLTTANASGAPWGAPGNADRSIQAEGTFGASAAIHLHGSNDGTNYHPLTDYNGDEIVLSAAGISAVSELTAWVKPVLTDGDGSTDVDVTMVFGGGR